jgi:hypothetical protein
MRNFKNILLFCLLVLLMTFTLDGSAGTGAIPSGPNIKLLKDNLRFKNTDTKIMTNDSDDPTLVAKNAAPGSIYIRTDGTMYQKQDAGSSTNWQSLLIGAVGNGTDNHLSRWDGTGTGTLQDSLAILDDVGALSGLTNFTVDFLNLNGNTISSSATNIVIDPFDGNINLPDLTASRPLLLDASNNIISTQIDLASTNDVTGILPVANGGTALSTTPTNGQLLVGDGVDYTLATITGTANQTIVTNGAGSITLSNPQDIHTGASPTFVGGTFTGLTASRFVSTNGSSDLVSQQFIDLTSEITGVLPIANGGTNSGTALNNDRIMESLGGSIVERAAMTNGQLIIGSTGANPVSASLTGTSNQVVVTNGAGSVTLSTPQDIHTAATPTFVDLTLSGLTQNSILFAGVGGLISEDNAGFTFLDGTNTFNLTGLMNVDNLQLDGNTLTTTDANGPLLLDAAGSGNVVVLADNISQRTNTDLDNLVGNEFEGVRNFYVKGDAAYGKSTDFVTGNNATFDGGGVLAGTLSVSTTAADLIDGPRVYSYVQAAGSLNDYIVSEVINIPRGYRGGEIGYEFRYKYDGDDDDIKFKVKCTTSSDLISTGVAGQNFKLKKFGIASAGSREGVGHIFVKTACEQIEVGFQVAVVNSGVELLWQKLKVTPDLTVTGTEKLDQTFTYDQNVTDIITAGGIEFNLTNMTNTGSQILTVSNVSSQTRWTAEKRTLVDIHFSAVTNNLNAYWELQKNGTVVERGNSPAVSGRRSILAGSIILEAGDYIAIGASATTGIENPSANVTLHIVATAERDTLLVPIVQTLTDSTEHVVTVSNSQGFGIPSASDVSYRRVGDSLEFSGRFTAGTVAPAEAQVNLPIVDGIQLAVKTGLTLQGKGVWFQGISAAAHGGAVLITGGDTFVNFSSFTVFSATAGNPHTPVGGSFVITSANFIAFNITIPIEGWSSEAVIIGAMPRDRTVYLWEEYPTGTDAGAFNSGAWRTRALNTRSGDLSFSSLSAGQVSLEDGCYLVVGSAPAYDVLGHKTRFENVTDTSTPITGTTEYIDVQNFQTRSFVRGTFCITENKDFEFQHQCQQTKATDGLGNQSVGFSIVDKYAEISITKLY